MTCLMLATVLQAATMANGIEEESYAEAYRDAMATGTPMVVFVSTQWCPPCQTMKKHILPEVRKRGVLNQVCFAQVDPDVDRGLSQQLIGGGPIPQLLMFRNTAGGWLRRKLVGGQSVASVEQFIHEGLKLNAATTAAQRQASVMTTVSR